MLKKVVTFSLVLLFAGISFGQNKALKPLGSAYISKGNDIEAKPIHLTKGNKLPVDNLNASNALTFDAQGLIDTLTYSEGYTGQYTNFGMFGQDVMIQFYQAPADLNIKAVGFATVENATNSEISVKLVKIGNGWTWDDLTALGVERVGYYPSEGDGFAGIAPFPDEATGDWVSEPGYPAPFGDDYDLWSDGGFGFPFTPTGDNTAKNYEYVEMMELGFEPSLISGDVFAVVLTHQGFNRDQATERIGIYSLPVAETGIEGWKYYENGRLVTGDTPPGDGGWWAREFTWDFEVVVELTGDVAPEVSGVTGLLTTVSTEARTVEATITDENPSGGAAGVASAVLKYSLDGGDYIDIPMTNTGGDVWAADIPGQAAGTEITYYIEATDVNGNVGMSSSTTYSIFEPTAHVPTLLVFNGYSAAEALGYPGAYYFGIDDFENFGTFDFPHDVWYYGPLEAAATTTYTNIIEITSPGGQTSYNDDVIREWLAASPDNNYMLAGQEYLGLRYGFENMTFGEGTFEYDILGVTESFNDISYAASGDQNNPSLLYAVEGSLLGDSLYTLFNSQPTDSLNYHPYYELSAAYANWVDGYNVTDDSDVDMLVLPLGAEVSPDNALPAVSHRTLTAGNKIAFMTIDPISVNSSPEYYWYGFSSVSPQVQVLYWFGADGPVDVRQVGSGIPGSFALDQNYPNPFNPTTSISYDIPNSGNVTLTIFDVLGRKVAELVNGHQNAGSYTATWNGMNQYGVSVTSGTYFYQLRTDNGFVQTKKMIMLK